MGFLDNVSRVLLLLLGLILMLRDHHFVDARQTIMLEDDFYFYHGLNQSECWLECASSSDTSERILYPDPIRFKEYATAPVLSFNTMFIVHLYLGGPSDRQNRYGSKINATNSLEGFTFAILPDKRNASYDTVGGSLGLLNVTSNGDPNAHTFGVEFDFKNNPEFSDPDGDDGGYHFGININSMNSTAWAPLIRPLSPASDYWRGNNYGHWLLQVWINYDGPTRTLNVNEANHGCPLSSGQPPDPPLYWAGEFPHWYLDTKKIPYHFLSHKVNLSTVLNEHMYVGFTSSAKLRNGKIWLYAWSLQTNSSWPTALSVALPCFPLKFHYLSYGAILSLILVILTAAAVIYGVLYAYYSRWVERQGWRFHIDPDDLAASEVHEFTYKELEQATKKFDKKQALGQGAFGSVYLGFLPGNREFVAVKHVVAKPGHGEREFMAEVMTLGKIRHRNLVRLQGWCHERGELLLVCDLMPNGSLDKLLFDPHNAPAPDSQPQQVDDDSKPWNHDDDETMDVKFPWERRFKAIVNVAKALVYLHTGCEECIIHRDVKSANVMLDAKYNARLGDFGLVCSYNHSLLAPASTGIGGTPGYLAPELYYTGIQTEQTDTFSYGAFLLEVACGKRPIRRIIQETVLVLVDEVWKMWGDSNILNASDPNLGGVYSIIELNMVLCLGLLCSHPNPAMRPSMKEVLLILNGDASLPHVPCSKPSGYEFERKFSPGSSSTTNPRMHHTTTIN